MKRTLGALALAAPWVLMPMAPANAGVCTDKTNPTAYMVCAGNANVQCGGVGMFGASHQTCTYPDGSRDECDWHMTSLTTSTGSCQWFAEPAPFPIGPPQP